MNVAILINGDRGVYIVKKLSYVKSINLKGIIYSDLKKRYFENNLKKFKKKLFFQKKLIQKNEKKLKSLNLDIILIAGFSQILKKHIINKAKKL